MSKTLIDALKAIASDPLCRIHLNSIRYRRISRATVQVGVASDSDRLKLVNDLANAKTAAEVQQITDAAAKLAYEKSHLVFTPDGGPLPVLKVVFNDRRANASLMFSIPGKVALPSDCPAGVPKNFPTTTVKNYTVVADGRLHIEGMRCDLTDPVKTEVESCGVKCTRVIPGVYDLDLSGSPVYDASAPAPDADSFIAYAWTLVDLSAEEKAIKSAVLKKSSAGLEESDICKNYGGLANAQYLAELGITDSGFSPKSVDADPTEDVDTVEVTVKFDGLSSIPSVNEVNKKIAGIENDLAVSGKTRKRLTAGEQFVKSKMDAVESRHRGAVSDAEFEGWAKNRREQISATASSVREALARARMAVVGGNIRFAGNENPDGSWDGVQNGVRGNLTIKSKTAKI